MKNYVTFLFFVFSFSLFSQNNKLETGEYSSTTIAAESLKMILSDNNKFQLSILSGTYEVVNDSVYFKTSYDDMPKFVLEYSNPNPKSDKITIDLGENSFYRFYNIYIGIQKNNDAQIEFKTIKELLNITNDFDYERKQLSFEIDKSNFIYFVEENLDKETFIEKYQISNNVSQIKVTYYSNDLGRLNLKGFYDQANKELIVSEGKIPLKFSLNKDVKKDILKEKPIEKRVEKDWTYPGKKEIDNYDYAVDTAVAVVDTSYAPSYIFKLKIDSNLKDALKQAKSHKNQFLVVINNPNSKKALSSFNSFIKNYESEVGYSMYDGYIPENDRFIFYFTSEKDKETLKNLGVLNNETLLVLNSEGQKLYAGNVDNYHDSFTYYNSSSTYSELIGINAKLKSDAVISNKKATLEDVEKQLLEVSKLEFLHSNEEITDKPIVNEVAVDSTFSVYGFDIFRQRKNVYQLKTKQDVLKDKWSKILENRLLEKEVNFTTVDIILREFNYDGFNKALYNSSEPIVIPTDLQSINYISKHYKTITNTKFNDTVATNYDYYNLNYTLTGVLDRNSDLSNNPSKEYQTKVLKSYKDLLTITNNNPLVKNSYMNALKRSEFFEEFLVQYEDFFNSLVKENTNLIENLDNAYKQNIEAGIGWNDFKYEFANNANEAAWTVVEKTKDVNWVKKAIFWSETSLKIEKDNSYYLDTLAQLYYKNGEKEKAIATESKAIENIKDNSTEQTEQYKIVLEKMKAGTY
ncbi:hypothetical protein [Flavobacterium koreense]